LITARTHGPVTELRMSTWRSHATGYAVSAYLVDAVLVDTGFSRVGAELAALLRGQPVRGVFLTHGHEDHAGNAARLVRAGLPICASEATREEIRRTAEMRFYRRFTWGLAEPVPPDAVPFDPAPWLAIQTPGHSLDHQVLWHPDLRVVFTGDLFLGVKVRLAHHGERPRALIRSLQAVAALGPVRMFDAHRGVLEDAATQLRAKAAWMSDTVGRIQALVDAGWSDDAIRREVLGREPRERWVSAGDYSRKRFVEAVRLEPPGP
jgi:glyoxylase-like metal-dependent hydrolase (beta-lactamase superfamily II)